MFKNRKLPIILQSEMAECGLACLAMIMGFYGSAITLSVIRRRFKSTLKGITLAKLKKIAETLKFSVTALRINIDQLPSLHLPCILHWEMNHFVVLKKMQGSDMIVHDPARGRRKITYEEYNNAFTGIALEIKPSSQFEASKKTNIKSVSLLAKSIKTHKASLLMIIAMSAMMQIGYIGGIRLLQKCIDSVNRDIAEAPTLLYFLLFAFIGTKLIEVAGSGVRSLMVTNLGTIINRDLSISLMKHLLSLPTSFFENRYFGDILSRFNGIERIRTTLTEGLTEGLIDGLISLLTLSMMFFYSSYMALVVIVTSFIYCLSRIFYNAKSPTLQSAALHARSLELSHFMETIKGVTAIKLFSKNEERLASWSQKLIRFLNTTTKIAWHKYAYDYAKNILYGLELALTLFFGCCLMLQHEITLGMFYAFFTCRQQFVNAFTSLIDKMHECRTLKLHIERLDDIVAEPSEIKSDLKPCHHVHIEEHNQLNLENISFAYALDEKPILQNINIVIEPKECVAITGPSGCGKTTLLKIMMGLMAPTCGNIKIGDRSVYPNHLLCYRKNIAGVLQDDVLFSGTIGDNVSFFDLDVDGVKLHRSAGLACILDEIKALPMGFDTLIGDMGSVLSGGQKQRILLARALYKEPSILFLDEASSHLDVAKEREVNAALKKLDMTIVLIAHRQETIDMADRVIYLKPA